MVGMDNLSSSPFAEEETTVVKDFFISIAAEVVGIDIFLPGVIGDAAAGLVQDGVVIFFKSRFSARLGGPADGGEV